jgi:hypothetical protein
MASDDAQSDPVNLHDSRNSGVPFWSDNIVLRPQKAEQADAYPESMIR